LLIGLGESFNEILVTQIIVSIPWVDE